MTDVVLVTGASSALGRALLVRLAASDSVVYAHHRRAETEFLDYLSGLGGRATLVPVQADFAVAGEVDQLIEDLRAGHIRPNKIVHLCAKPLALERFSKLKWAELQTDLDISLRALVQLGQSFLPELARERVGGRVVVALSSVTIGVPPKGMLAYTTVKYALLGLMRALATEYAEAGIMVNAVSPYTMETAFLAGVPHKFAEVSAALNPARRNATPDDVVPAIEFLLSDAARFISGSNIPVAAGASF